MGRKTSPHDPLFREIYSQKKYRLDIFKLVLTPAQFHLFDWRTLKSELTVTLNQQWQEQRADLVFSVQLKNAKRPVRIVFIVDHKSSHDPKLLVQLLKYQVERYIKDDLPIIPILVYHGEQKNWPSSLNFQQSLQGMTTEIQREFGDNILNFTCKMLNIKKLNFKSEKTQTLTSTPILYIMREIWQVDEEVIARLFKIGEQLNHSGRKYLLERSLSYARTRNRALTWRVVREIEEKTVADGEKRIMSEFLFALDEEHQKALKKGMKEGMEKGKQEGIQKGMQKGKKKGKQEIALKLIKMQMSVPQIAAITDFSPAQIRRLKKQNS